MSFRRIPFQFSTTDPVERQQELEKRFGLPSRSNMYVDVANPLSMGASNKDPNSCSSSPRLQHRVPIFVEGYDQPITSSVDSASSYDTKKKSNVRVVPIKVEGDEIQPTQSTRHRTFSGPAGLQQEANEFISQQGDKSPLKRSMQDLAKPSKLKSMAGPRVYNIPVQIEDSKKSSNKPLNKKFDTFSDHAKFNGCSVSKPTERTRTEELKEKEQAVVSTKEKPEGVEFPLKKIQDVLEELKQYECGVQEFNGTVKDKQYRYLDEMLTRCMLRLDDIDTMGNKDVRAARKNAVKKVQVCIDLLESKVNPENQVIADYTSSNMNNSNEQVTDIDMKEDEGKNLKDICPDEIEVSEGNEIQSNQPTMYGEGLSQDKVSEISENYKSNEAEDCKDSGVVIEKSQMGYNMDTDVDMAQSDSEVKMGIVNKQSDVQDIFKGGLEVNEIEMTERESSECNTVEAAVNNVPEVEMNAVKYTSLSVDSNASGTISEDNAENTKIQNITSEGKPGKTEESEALESKVSDVEMEEVQSTLNDIQVEISSPEKNIDLSSGQTLDSDCFANELTNVNFESENLQSAEKLDNCISGQ